MSSNEKMDETDLLAADAQAPGGLQARPGSEAIAPGEPQPGSDLSIEVDWELPTSPPGSPERYEAVTPPSGLPRASSNARTPSLKPVSIVTFRPQVPGAHRAASSTLAGARTPPQISEEDLRILDDLERMSQGAQPSLESEKVKPAQMVATLIRLLIRKGVIEEMEFLEELSRK